MNKKTVCIIRSNPVNPDSRVEKEAWALASAGYDVHVLAWDRSKNAPPEDTCIRVMGKDIPITRLCYKASFGEGVKNIVPYLRFQTHMRKWLKKHDFDIVHACDFDTAFFSQPVASKKKERFVFDIFDFLYGEPKSFLQRRVKNAQLSIINKADATILCTEEREAQISGSNPKKLCFIHNTPAEGMKQSVSSVMKKTERIKIVYVGILQDYRLLQEIADYISSDRRLEFHVGGFGKYEDFFIAMSNRYENIIYYGKLSYEQTLALEDDSDIMLAVYDPIIENHRFAAPNKFYESLMLGKPVIMVRGTGMSHIVEENDTGVLIEYSKNSFADGVNRLIDRRDEWSEMQKRAESLYRERYRWAEMTKRLISLYETL